MKAAADTAGDDGVIIKIIKKVITARRCQHGSTKEKGIKSKT